jgi:hypothetical protein
LQAALLAREGFAAESGLAALLDSLKLKPDAHQTCLLRAVQWMQEIGVRPPAMHAHAHAVAGEQLAAGDAANGVRVLDRQADVVADVADVEPAKREAFVRGLGLPELKASKLLKALAGEVRR